ncbi:hypothetical protein FHW37_101238 [Neorhizobium alkalisoli]|uniref:Agmatine deiminase n=2 Tax=Neorhizobium alkalisoli TaxID=528178 RepID=A0A561R741_9HYPH|nr:hypothetical protein FHW37_101238 [Neorhizobium alkalisoli]
MAPEGGDPGNLVPDCGGIIKQIALALPAAFLGNEAPDDGFQPLIPIGNLLCSLPADIEVFLLVEQATASRADFWARSLNAQCRIALVSVPEEQGRISSPWIQDAFLVREASGSTTDEILTTQMDAVGRSLADMLSIEAHPAPLFLPGGNQLVGPDFRLIGLSQVKAEKGSSPAQPAFEISQQIDRRPVHVFGYNPKDLSKRNDDQAKVRTLPEAKNLLSAGHQFGFHVDQFVSVTGLERNGRPLLLVGDPCDPDGLKRPLVETARQSLDASVRALIRQGFEVMRNPVPYAVTPDSGKRLPRLYNNLMLENEVRPGREKPFAWLPQFGDIEPLAAFDRLNSEIWEGLGFEVIPVFGWSHLASRNGALRCSTKVLRRSPLRRLGGTETI